MNGAGLNSLNGLMTNALQNSGQARIGQAVRNLDNADPARLDKIKDTAQDFEAVFISQMMSYMFESVEVDPMFGGGQGEEMFRSMMVEEYGKQMAAQGGIGIAGHVQAKLIEMQAASQL